MNLNRIGKTVASEPVGRLGAMMADWALTTSLYTPQGQRKYLTGAERERFIATSGLWPRPDVGLLCLTIAYTGCRISEALSLCKASLLPELGIIAVRSLKKRKRLHVREIPVPGFLLKALTDYAAKLDCERLWTFSRSQAWRLIKEVMQAASIPPGIHATPKGLRHAFGLHAVRSKIPLNLLQRWLGHANLKTTAIYADAIGQEEQDIAARMWVSLPDFSYHPEESQEHGETRDRNDAIPGHLL